MTVPMAAGSSGGGRGGRAAERPSVRSRGGSRRTMDGRSAARRAVKPQHGQLELVRPSTRGRSKARLWSDWDADFDRRGYEASDTDDDWRDMDTETVFSDEVTAGPVPEECVRRSHKQLSPFDIYPMITSILSQRSSHK